VEQEGTKVLSQCGMRSKSRFSSRKGACLRADTHRQAKDAKEDPRGSSWRALRSWRETRTRPHAKAPRAQRKTEAKVFVAIFAIFARDPDSSSRKGAKGAKKN